MKWSDFSKSINSSTLPFGPRAAKSYVSLPTFSPTTTSSWPTPPSPSSTTPKTSALPNKSSTTRTITKNQRPLSRSTVSITRGPSLTYRASYNLLFRGDSSVWGTRRWGRQWTELVRPGETSTWCWGKGAICRRREAVFAECFRSGREESNLRWCGCSTSKN